LQIIHLDFLLTIDNIYIIQFVYVGGIHDYLDTVLCWRHICNLQEHVGGLIALANTMERTPVEIKTWENWDVIQFPPSLKMSTYIVAFAVGPYVKKEVTNEDGTLIRIWGWPGQEEYLGWAAEISAKCFHAMRQYTDFPYPYTKSDQLGMPEFLHSTKVKEMASETICHEISHQWFGDTVTETWWDDLFLSEGFATLFETASQKMADGKFLVNTMQTALTSDANVTYSHPLYDVN
uniref:Peptidase M1 membrane alanine aminopeptidase domain-containing protein n=1 Tax=Parascaris equorum TaxID=6256 RepID=A0A914RJL4_PAREQ